MSAPLNLVPKDDVAVAPTVLLGFLDVEAVGLRTLLGLVPAEGALVKSTELALQSTSDDVVGAPLELSSIVSGAPPLSLVSFFRASSSSPEVSLVIVNTAIPPLWQPYVAETVVRFVRCRALQADPGSTLHVGVAAGILANSAPSRQATDGVGASVFLHTVARGTPAADALSGLAGLPITPLPSNQRIRDPMLAALLAALRGAGVSSSFLVVPAHKPSKSSDASEVEAAQQRLCPVLGTALAALTALPSQVSLPKKVESGSGGGEEEKTESAALPCTGSVFQFSAERCFVETGPQVAFWRAEGEESDCGGGDVMYI